AKVADFGLSTRMEHQETHLSSCFQGTLTHMAPEVMLEGRISKAADVYSFGILMWELFCASEPFAGVPRAHLGHAITKEGRRPKFPPFAPHSFVSLATRCWDPDASLRPTFEEVLTELTRIRDELGGSTPVLQILPPQAPVEGAEGGTDRGGSFGGGGALRGFGSGTGGMGGGGDDGGGNNMFGEVNPLALYGAGIVVGSSSIGGSSMGGM
ncbi:putative serine/threonine-protein kinase, partial [Tetrabaena socialis]